MIVIILVNIVWEEKLLSVLRLNLRSFARDEVKYRVKIKKEEHCRLHKSTNTKN